MKTISSRFYFRAKNAIQCLKSDYYLLLKKLLKCLKICIHHIRDRFSLRILLLQLVQKSDFHVPGVENQVYVAGQTDKRAIPDNPGSHHRPHIAYELFGAGHPYSGIPRSFLPITAIAVEFVTVSREKTIRQTDPRLHTLGLHHFEQECEQKQCHLAFVVQLLDIFLQERKRQVPSDYLSYFFFRNFTNSSMKPSLIPFWLFIFVFVFS